MTTQAPPDPVRPPGRSATRGPRLCLRPGARVVRRDEGHLQVGLGALAVVVPDEPEVAAVLDRLAGGHPVEAVRVPSALRARLDGRGLLVEARLLGATGSGEQRGREAVLAAVAARGPAAEPGLAARRECRVEVRGTGAWAREARALVERAGLALRAPTSRLPGSESPVLLLAAGEPRRAVLDDVVRDGRPHLVVASVQGTVRVGPFAVPGVTACLRCVDAHAGERDPRHALVVEQQERADGLDPVDPVLGNLAVALAVGDLVAWAEGDRPTTWSATLELRPGARPDGLVPRRWPVHPCCGCSWGARLPV